MKISIIFPKDSIGFFLKDSDISFGGATVQLHQIASVISKTDNDLICLLPSSNMHRDKIRKKYPIVEPYKKDDILPVKFIKLLAVLNVKRPQVVIQRGLVLLTILFALLCKVFGIKYVFMFAHDVETRGFYQNSRKKARFFKLLLWCSHRLICQSNNQVKNIPAKYLHKTFLIKKGIETKQIDSATKKYDAAWIGRCDKWKRPQDFLKLAKRNPDRKFLMICSKISTEVDFFEQIEKQAKELTNLEFHDKVPNRDVYGYLNKTRVFCITSDMEGDWPMTVLEAASCGLPTLSLYFDNDDFLKSGNGGYYCEGKFEIFNEKLLKLLNSAADYKEKSKAAREYIQLNYNIKNNVKKLLEII